MLQTQAQPRPRQRPSTTHADRRFKGYRPEREQAVRVPDVKEDSTLRQLKVAWRRFEYEECIEHETRYKQACGAISGLSYSAEDVRNFSIVLAQFQDEELFGKKAGLFLSALINNCNESDFLVHTKHLSVSIRRLGYRNRKNITIDGYAGDYMGAGMECGRIIVKGNAGPRLGLGMKAGTIIVEGDADYCVGDQMKGGEIIVQGNAGVAVGSQMDGGTITIKGNASDKVGDWMGNGTIVIEGNAGENVGWRMSDGKIYLNGEYQGLATGGNGVRGGQIFHQGKQIYPKPGAN